MKKLLWLLLLPVSAFAADAVVNWTHPTQFTDGSALAVGNIASTRVEFGSCAGTAFGVKAGEVIVPAPATTATITNLAPGTHCFRAYTRTVAAVGALESAATAAVSKVVPFVPPNPPVLSTVVTLVWDIQQKRYGWMVARQVGTVPLGTQCSPEKVVLNRGYYEVPLDKVTLTRLPRSAIVVSKCEAT